MKDIKEILGEEYKGDSRFVAECRKLQSIYRAEIGEEIHPYKDRNGHVHHYGNYISNGEVAKEGCWKNFLTVFISDCFLVETFMSDFPNLIYINLIWTVKAVADVGNIFFNFVSWEEWKQLFSLCLLIT